MKAIGITGGIGSGKSLACEMFEILGAPVFHADIVAKNLINTSEKIKFELKERFGNDIYDKDGFINRKKFGGIIFNDKSLLEFTNKLIHPEVIKAFDDWKVNQKDVKYVLHEAAILFESGVYKRMDEIIYVYAPEIVRIERVIKRDNISEQLVRERIGNQWDFEKVKDRVDFIIHNDGIEPLIPQVLSIHHKLVNK